MKKHVFIGIIALVLSLSLIGCGTAFAAFPDKAITWVIPWPPGGANDICARLIAPGLEKILGVPVVLTNTEGAGGWIGYNTLLDANADGYTISMVSLPGMIAHAINPQTRRNNTYRDFAPLVNFARDYVLICTRPDEDRFSNLAEIIEYSKNNDGVLIAGTAGAGDDGIMIALLNMVEGADFIQVATTGSAGSLTNLYGGHVDICIANVSEVGAALKDGLLKIVVVAAENRVPQFPDVPTVMEAIGIPIVVDSSRGIITKAGVPEDALKVLRDALTQALESKEVRERLATAGIDVEIADWQKYQVIMQETEDLMYELGPRAFGWDVKR